jgi:putative ABC transport system permease protein
MLRNYLIIGFRNLMRNKSYAALNIAGLAVGIAACVLIFAVVRFELSYDTFHRNYSRIYRVVTESRYASGELATNPGAPIPVPVALRQEVPQLEKVAALQTTYGSQITVLGSDPGAGVSPRKFIEELGILFVEPEFFEIFDAQWLAGNPREALAKPNTVVLAKTSVTGSKLPAST